MARDVVGADGAKWTIRRRWGRVPRWRGLDPGGADIVDVATAWEIPGLDAVLVILGLALLVLLFLVPLVVFLAGLAALVMGGAARVLLLRPWTIEARCGTRHLEWRSRGWRASARKIDEVATSVERGEL